MVASKFEGEGHSKECSVDAGSQPEEQSEKSEPKSKRNGPKWTQNEKACMAGKEGCRFARGAVGLGVNGKHRLRENSQRDKEHRLKLDGALLVTCFDSSREIWNWASPAYCSAALCLENHHHKGACIAVSHFCQPSLNLASHAQVICVCLRARVHWSTHEGLLHKAQNSWINYFC